MNTISNTTNMTIRIDKNFKKNIDELFKNLGINTTSAIMMFLKQCEREQGLPFVATMESPRPSKELLKSLKEIENIKSGKKKAKSYNNMESLIKALDE